MSYREFDFYLVLMKDGTEYFIKDEEALKLFILKLADGNITTDIKEVQHRSLIASQEDVNKAVEEWSLYRA